MRRLMQFLKQEEGVTVVEYAVLLVLIILALVGVIGVFSGNLESLYESFLAPFE